jgi:hypothetical protein
LAALVTVGCTKDPMQAFERTNPLDPGGTILQSLTSWGGPGIEIFGAAVPAPDGGCVVCGSTTSWGNGLYDAFVTRFRNDGSVAWSTTYGGTSYDNGSCITPSPDGGYVLCGMSRPDGGGPASLLLVKFTADGDTVWARRHNGGNETIGNWIEPATGGYIVSGFVNQVGGFLAKFDSGGALVWWRNISGSGEMVKPAADGGYYAVSGPALIRTDSVGTVVWEHASTIFSVVEPTPDGGFVAATGALLVKRDASDQTQWTLNYAGTGIETIRGLRRSNNGGYAMAAADNNVPDDGYLLVATGGGAVSHTVDFPGLGFARTALSTGSGCWLIGQRTGGGSDDLFLVRTKPAVE